MGTLSSIADDASIAADADGTVTALSLWNLSGPSRQLIQVFDESHQAKGEETVSDDKRCTVAGSIIPGLLGGLQGKCYPCSCFVYS